MDSEKENRDIYEQTVILFFEKYLSREVIEMKALQYYLSCLFIGLLSQSVISDEPDPYLWLEEVGGKRSLAWVEERIGEHFLDIPSQMHSMSNIRKSRQSSMMRKESQAPTIRMVKCIIFGKMPRMSEAFGGKLHFESYLEDQPVWENILDIDQLAESEGIQLAL